MKGDEFKDDFRKALPREVVQRLTRRSAWRATAAVLEDVVVIAIAVGVALYYWPHPLVIALSVVVIGTRQHALFIIAASSTACTITTSTGSSTRIRPCMAAIRAGAPT